MSLASFTPGLPHTLMSPDIYQEYSPESQGLASFHQELASLRFTKLVRQLPTVKFITKYNVLQTVKYLTPNSRVLARELMKGFCSCMQPAVKSSVSVVAVWIIFEEQEDYQLFVSNPRSTGVSKWETELLPLAKSCRGEVSLYARVIP